MATKKTLSVIFGWRHVDRADLSMKIDVITKSFLESRVNPFIVLPARGFAITIRTVKFVQKLLPGVALSIQFASALSAPSSFEQGNAFLNSELNLVATWNDESVLLENAATLAPMRDVIRGAQKFLYLNFLVIACDAVTEPLIQDLTAAVKRNVRVRVAVNQNYAWLVRPCLARLENAGIEVQKTRTHQSYLVNDRRDLLFGSQSVAWMFFETESGSIANHDWMAKFHGPIATEAARSFLATWMDTSDAGDLRRKFGDELAWIEKQRAEDAVMGGFGDSRARTDAGTSRSTETCAWLNQNFERGEATLFATMRTLIERAQKSITWTGVQVSAQGSEAKSLTEQLALASLRGVAVQFIGNGKAGGNGEMTMELDRLLRKNKGIWYKEIWNSGFHWLKEWDVRRVWTQHQENYRALLKDNSIRIATYPDFIHGKAWGIDGEWAIITSANIDGKSFGAEASRFIDSGIVCRAQLARPRGIVAQLHALLAKDLGRAATYESR